jgi:hypothetical protein
MIEQLLHAARAPFITVRDGSLHVGDNAYGELTVLVHEARPIRKLFNGRKVTCHSLDCRTGKNGTFCELCPDRHRCSQRLELRVVYRNDGQDDHPAILELSHHSFRAFDQCLQQIGDIGKLPTVLVRITAVQKDNDWTTLRFEPLF